MSHSIYSTIVDLRMIVNYLTSERLNIESNNAVTQSWINSLERTEKVLHSVTKHEEQLYFDGKQIFGDGLIEDTEAWKAGSRPSI